MSQNYHLLLPPSRQTADFVQLLQQLQVAHRITETPGGLQLWLADEASLTQVEQLWQQFQADPARFALPSQQAVVPGRGAASLAELRHIPVVAISLVLSLLVALLTHLGDSLAGIAPFTFTPIIQQDGQSYLLSLGDSLAMGQWWRLLSPIFIHFGLLHLVMNLLWTWELGRRIEQHSGSLFLLGLLVISGVLSNLAQYLVSPGALFGGLSGVLYALLGYCWIYQRLCPVAAFRLPSGVVTLMLVWLVLCFSGLVSLLGFGQIANAAHLSGLVLGCLAGAVAGWLARLKSPRGKALD